MYTESWNMGKVGWGFVCIGGQNDSVMVSIKAQGLYAARSGWERRLYKFINSIDSAKLTRVDLAHDAFDSQLSINDYFHLYRQDKFTSRGRRPSVELLGDWVNENIKGRTLNIGNRKSGKLLRIYEKGRQLGRGFSDQYPNWIRVELEIRASQRELPTEMLLKPAQYLAGAYPALAFICENQEVIKTIKKSTKMTVSSSIEVTRHQFGKHIKFHAELFGAAETIQILTEGVTELPERLDIQDYSTFDFKSYCKSENLELLYIHQLLNDFTPTDLERLDYQTFINNN
ncbi:MAG: replication initiation factor domain-containing protein [Methylococcales bacterium]|nr:replication initiation factor domain-containing protein [Methylococcales bacterium]